MKDPKRRWLLLTTDLALFAGVVIIGYLQSRRVNAGFWTNYGADVVGPVWLYSGLRQLRIWKGRYPSAELAAGGIFAGCFLWEWCQRYDLRGTLLGITRGSFDPYDVLSYAGSLGVAYAVDRTIQTIGEPDGPGIGRFREQAAEPERLGSVGGSSNVRSDGGLRPGEPPGLSFVPVFECPPK